MELSQFTTANGIPVPLPFGTWELFDGEETARVIRLALQEGGYRHIDTAAYYRNERSVGEAVRTCGIPREDIFVTSKLLNVCTTYDATRECCERALEATGLEYFDAYFIHWTAPAGVCPDWRDINAARWRAMEDLQAKGKIRCLGVSNFGVRHLEALAETARMLPHLLQTKLHPGLYEQQAELLGYCDQQGIVVEAYSPMLRGKLIGNESLEAIAGEHGVSTAQVCLRWCLQRNALPIAKASSLGHMLANRELDGFQLEPEEMSTLDHLPVEGAFLPDLDAKWRD